MFTLLAKLFTHMRIMPSLLATAPITQENLADVIDLIGGDTSTVDLTLDDDTPKRRSDAQRGNDAQQRRDEQRGNDAHT